MHRSFVIIVFVVSLLYSSAVFSVEDTNPSVNPAQQLFQERVGKVQWKNISLEFRPVSDKAGRGLQSMVVQSADQENGKTYFVGKSTILGLKDINNIDVTYNPTDVTMLRLLVLFNQDGKKTLQDYTTAHLNEMMGVVIDGKLRLVAHIRQPLVNGMVQVYGLAPNEAVDIARRYYQPKLELARKINEELTAKAQK